MSMPSGPYTISAAFDGKLRESTRCNPASAVCLADDWAEEGGSDIQIAGADGLSRSTSYIRDNLTLRKLVIRRQREAWTP